MWSDPEITRVDAVRDATNRDLAERTLFGGWAYPLCGVVIIALSPQLRAEWLTAALFLVAFLVIAWWRARVCAQASAGTGESLRRFDQLAPWLYLPLALLWSLFMMWTFASIRQFDATVAIALIVSQGIFVGGVAANFQRIRLMVAYSIIMCVLPIVALAVLIPGYLALSILLLAAPYSAFVVVNSKFLHHSYWSNWEQRLRLEQQAGELERARVRADAANNAKSAFLANMSHEIRTPMNGVLGMAELLTHSPLNAEQQKQLAVIRSSGRSLLRVIDDILDFAKLEANKLALAVRPFNPVELMQELAVLFQARAEQSGVALHLIAPPGLPKAVLGDSDRIRQVMANLLGNAFKFTQQGSVVFQVEYEAPGADGIARFAFIVTDTGIGISAVDQQQLFQEFVQVGAPTQHIQGTGLGLVISRNLVNLMGGEISLHSEPGKGSSFRVMLPLQLGETTAEVVVEPPPRPVSLPIRAAVRIKVLLVEDNPINQLVSEAMLRELGCEVTLAEDGQAAVDLFSRQQPDLIFMDCNMPVMDGFESTRRIRQLEEARGLSATPIIALTAHALEEVRQECFAAGMNAHISKPFSMEQMQEVLRQYLPV